MEAKRLVSWLALGIGALTFFVALSCQQSATPSISTPIPTSTPTAAPAVVTVYFPRLKEQDVEFIPVKRTVPAAGDELDMARAALIELINGPTDAEKTQGLGAPIPQGVRLLGLRIERGVAYPNFSQEIEAGGSLRVMAISQSVRRTLLEFHGVQRVVIAVEGRTEDVLQP